jgi:hypothetical protein
VFLSHPIHSDRADSLKWTALALSAAVVLVTCFGPNGSIDDGVLGEQVLFIVIAVGSASALLLIMSTLERIMPVTGPDDQDGRE